MAIGEIGLGLKDFYMLTYNEYHYIAKAYMLKDEREWLRTRMLASLLINVQMPKDKHITPEQLFALPSDSLIKKKKPTPTKSEMMAAFERYRKDKQD
ncbi:hypothetical protein SAMN04487898_105165 [Pedobacter sp. ok626]|uniref:hypothetical protein n=1 Tax=Pedobacter sp. ok626 TaxID=1761882 RepID=UPI0008884150|nr:hypothetical protein [Pedobacter sp. ok626]SDJ96371.1 hypothetical protein SAMN04487898_105165 [Pedobacter sp. ok626]